MKDTILIHIKTFCFWCKKDTKTLKGLNGDKITTYCFVCDKIK